VGNNKKIIIYGTGAMTNVVYTIFREEGIFDVEAFTVDGQFKNSEEFLGLPVTEFENIENIYPPDDFDMLIVVGYRNIRHRKMMFNAAKSKGYYLVSYIGDKVIDAHKLQYGENNIIFNSVYIGQNCIIGDNNIIRPMSMISHDVMIGSHNFLSTSVNIGGASRVGNMCFLGMSTVVIDKVKIADETMCGARSLILKDTEKCSSYIGHPSKKVGEHFENGIILSN
jgi:sugar O-acyltransferase (sialic acid O-acetyltransferase NeuD family)